MDSVLLIFGPKHARRFTPHCGAARPQPSSRLYMVRKRFLDLSSLASLAVLIPFWRGVGCKWSDKKEMLIDLLALHITRTSHNESLFSGLHDAQSPKLPQRLKTAKGAHVHWSGSNIYSLMVVDCCWYASTLDPQAHFFL